MHTTTFAYLYWEEEEESMPKVVVVVNPVNYNIQSHLRYDNS